MVSSNCIVARCPLDAALGKLYCPHHVREQHVLDFMADGLSKADAWEKVNRLARVAAAAERKRLKDLKPPRAKRAKKRGPGGSVAAVRQRRREVDLCPDCGDVPVLGQVYCKRCTARKHPAGAPRTDDPKNVKAARGRYYDASLEAGSCVDCPRKAVRGRVRCVECLEKARARRRGELLDTKVRKLAAGDRVVEDDLVDTGDYEDDGLIEVDNVFGNDSAPEVSQTQGSVTQGRRRSRSARFVR